MAGTPFLQESLSAKRFSPGRISRRERSLSHIRVLHYTLKSPCTLTGTYLVGCARGRQRALAYLHSFTFTIFPALTV